jgi:hypothetical protein
MLNKIILKRFPKADENKKPPIKYTELIIGVVLMIWLIIKMLNTEI